MSEGVDELDRRQPDYQPSVDDCDALEPWATAVRQISSYLLALNASLFGASIGLWPVLPALLQCGLEPMFWSRELLACGPWFTGVRGTHLISQVQGSAHAGAW